MKKCLNCDFEWKPRVKKPRACPRCKCYDWRIKKIKLKKALNHTGKPLTMRQFGEIIKDGYDKAVIK